jgi:hypothetical protein
MLLSHKLRKYKIKISNDPENITYINKLHHYSGKLHQFGGKKHKGTYVCSAHDDKELRELRAKQKEKFEQFNVSTNSFIKKSDLTSHNKEYAVHDNGGRPFKVVVNNKGIEIYTTNDNEYPAYNIHILSLKKFIGYWVGFDSSYYTAYHGNSILVQETKHSYVSIGWIIYRFRTDEEIQDYISPIGGSDVPYPISLGENNVYFMLDNKYISKDDLMVHAIPINAELLYSEFYGHIYPDNKKNQKEHKFKKYELLVKRR